MHCLSDGIPSVSPSQARSLQPMGLHNPGTGSGMPHTRAAWRRSVIRDIAFLLPVIGTILVLVILESRAQREGLTVHPGHIVLGLDLPLALAAFGTGIMLAY